MLQADPYALRYLANRFSAAADELRRNAGTVVGISHHVTDGATGWRGQGSQEFVLRMEHLANAVRDAVKPFETIVATLQTLANRVEMILAKQQQLTRLQQERSRLHFGLNPEVDAEIVKLDGQIYLVEVEIATERAYADLAAAAAFREIQVAEWVQSEWQQLLHATTAVATQVADVEQLVWSHTPDSIKEAVKEVADFAEGFTATYLQNEAMGLADPLHEEFPEDRSKAYKVGRIIGDIDTFVQGASEMLSGGSLLLLGGTEAVVTAPTGVLPLIGVGAVALGAVGLAHGGASFYKATDNFKKDWDLFEKEGSSSGGKGGTAGTGEVPAGLRGQVKAKGLPTDGRFHFVPDGEKVQFNKSKGGYVDRYGNVWVKGPYHGDPKLGFTYEWDVQLSESGKKAWGKFANGKGYINVRPDGGLSH